jgi:radical SAM-linked protein
VISYRAKYEKVGLARFISHNDLINCLQRGFRRAGVPVEFSRGFHPKMRMSFAPALALGMQGRREMLDFRSGFEIEAGEFCVRVNGRLPEGIRVLDLKRLREDDPPLSHVSGFEYSVDLGDSEIQGAVLEMRQNTPEYSALSFRDIVARRIEEYASGLGREDGDGITWAVQDGELRITVPMRPARSIRVQDVLEELFGCRHPSFLLVRERILFRS